MSGPGREGSAADASSATASADYAERLRRKQDATWKRVLNVQAPYRWNVRRQQLGRTLDVGCGIGRNLSALPTGSLGVDTNAHSVATARARGFDAMTPDEFEASQLARPASFDGMLLAHVIEHLDAEDGAGLVRRYLPYLRPDAKVFFVCPQERGYASDPTHVRFVDGAALAELATGVGLVPDVPFSFPFPRAAGKLFIYNEFCLLARLPAEAT